MQTHRRPWRAMRRPIVVLTVAALASACAGHTSPEAGPPTTSTARATTTTAPDPKAAVLAAYQRFWDVWLAANNPPNPNDPRLAEVDAGAQLAGARQSIRRHQDLHQRVVLPKPTRYVHNAAVTLLNPGATATVIDCAIDDSMLVSSSGRVLDASVQTQLIDADMVREGGRWKVSYTRFVKKWAGVGSCARG
jgi:hypothetical protein